MLDVALGIAAGAWFIGYYEPSLPMQLFLGAMIALDVISGIINGLFSRR